MIEMPLSSRHRIRNLSPGGLRLITLPLGHGSSPQYWLSHVDGEETFFVSFKPPRPGTEPRALAWKAAVLTTNLGPPPTLLLECWCLVTFNTMLYVCHNNHDNSFLIGSIFHDFQTHLLFQTQIFYWGRHMMFVEHFLRLSTSKRPGCS